MKLREFLEQAKALAQGASNGVASNISGPIDLINSGLNMVGAGTPNPFGGSVWMNQKGFTAPPQRQLAGAVGEGIGMAAPQALASKAGTIAELLNVASDNVAIPATLSKQRGVINLGAGDSSALQSTEKVFGNTAVDGMTKSTKLYPNSGHSVVFASNKGLIPTQPTLKQAGLDRYASGTGQMGSAPLEVLSVNADGPLRYVVLDGHHRGAVNILRDPNGFQPVKIVGEYTPKGIK